jgi:hypothetical protein
VQVYVCQQWADNLSLSYPGFVHQEPTFVDYSDVDPFAYQPLDAPSSRALLMHRWIFERSVFICRANSEIDVPSA